MKKNRKENSMLDKSDKSFDFIWVTWITKIQNIDSQVFSYQKRKFIDLNTV